MLKNGKLLFTRTALILGALLVFVTAFTASATDPRQDWGMWGPNSKWWEDWHSPQLRPWHQQRMERHWRFMHGEFPDEYKFKTNPLKPTKETVNAGAQIYKENCASCHGKEGMGDGIAAKDLRPSPALLAYLIQRPVAADSYLMWTISEGGKVNKTEMPAFKDTLTEEDMWKVIIFMRDGFRTVK